MRTLFLSLIMACSACSTNAEPPAAPKAAAPAAPVASANPAGGTLEQIRALIGNAACTDASQCRTLPIGARPCGGPEAYLAYSTSSSPEAQLLALAERHKQERAAIHAASGMMSNCRFMPDPGAVCVAGTCQLAPAGKPAS
ncbi:hypothetical protein ASF77_09160 [Massilia sp. Leaf139]|nr:hypothetical protein ASF77_09160 [Massilia sp. Leaf139]